MSAKPSPEAPPDGTQAGGLRIPYRRYFWLLAGAWTAVVAGSLAWNLVQHADQLRSVATEAARSLLEKDLLYREWSLLHGGVYVPDSAAGEPAASPPGEERQVVTPSGRPLTLLNPALVSRQIFEIQNERSGIQGHLRQQAETERERVVSELQDALANVKALRGLIPICSSCKNIRNDQGYWTQLETYLQQHTNAQFSHGICVDCLRKLYPEFSGEVEAHLGVRPR